MTTTHVTIIHGAPATGKTHSAAQFMEHYGRTRAIDWELPRRKARMEPDSGLVPGSLLLTTEQPHAIIGALHERTIRLLSETKTELLRYDLISIEHARAAIGLPPKFIFVRPLMGLPVSHDTEFPGSIVDRNGRELLVIDVDNERPNAEVTAIADAVVRALNAKGAF